MPNPFLDDYEDETDQPSNDNQNFKQLRDYSKKLERQVNSGAKELEELRKFKQEVEAERRTMSVAQIFKKVGLSEKHAGLFAKLNDGDVTEDAVIQFATEYELPRTEVPVADEPEPTDTVQSGEIREIAPAEAGSAPVVQGFAPASGAQLPGGKIITTVEEAIEVQTTNPAEFARLYQAGRVKLAKLPGSGETRLPG